MYAYETEREKYLDRVCYRHKKARTWRAYSAKGGLSVAAKLLRLTQHDTPSHMKHMHFFF